VVSSALLVWSVTWARQNSLQLVSGIFASWNQLEGWLRQVEVLRTAA